MVNMNPHHLAEAHVATTLLPWPFGALETPVTAIRPFARNPVAACLMLTHPPSSVPRRERAEPGVGSTRSVLLAHERFDL